MISTAMPLASTGARRDILADTHAGADTATTATIASINDQDWYISRTHGVYHIPACAPTGPPVPRTEGAPEASARGAREIDEPGGSEPPYTLLVITSRGDALDLGDNRRFPFTIPARKIAEDLIQDLQDHGVFVCAGARPTPDELRAAAERRDSYYHRLVAEGDTMWARGHSFREISDLHRRAAIALGIERDWAYVPARMAECPACGEKVKPGVAVCRHCRAILDAEKASKHGLAAAPSRAKEHR